MTRDDDDFGGDIERGLAALESHLADAADDTRQTVFLAARSLAKAHPGGLVDTAELVTALGRTYSERRIAIELRGLVADGRLYALGEGLYSLIPVAVAEADEDGQGEPATQPSGETREVRALRNELAEARKLAALRGELAEVDVDSKRVDRRRRDAAEAAKLYTLDQAPQVKALRDRRMLARLNLAALVGLVLALGWSTHNVQPFAAGSSAPWSPGWIFAWLVEPVISIVLLTIVAAKAYCAMRGHLIEHKTLDAIEWGALGLTLFMQLYPVLPAPAGKTPAGTPFVALLPTLVLHSLGALMAVAIVRAMPLIWRAFASLDPGLPSTPSTPAPLASTPASTPATSDNAGVRESGSTGGPEPVGTPSGHVATLTERAIELIRTGKLRPGAGKESIRLALNCGATPASQVRDQLRARGL